MKKVAIVDRARCAACGACTKVCPRGAVSIHRGCWAVVEESRCVGCGLCEKTCPAGCVATKERRSVQ